jgi:hypothetical protein
MTTVFQVRYRIARFVGYNIPKLEQIFQRTTKYTNIMTFYIIGILNSLKIDQMTIKYTNNFIAITFKIYPNFVCLKIWHLWSGRGF